MAYGIARGEILVGILFHETQEEKEIREVEADLEVRGARAGIRDPSV